MNPTGCPAPRRNDNNPLPTLDLAATGADVAPWLAVGFGLIDGGILLGARSRRRTTIEG